MSSLQQKRGSARAIAIVGRHPTLVCFLLIALSVPAPAAPAPTTPPIAPAPGGPSKQDNNRKVQPKDVRSDVVVRASEVDDESKRNPGSISVIRPGEQPGREQSLAELLEREAGVRIRRYGGRGAYTTVSLRGSNPNQVRIYIDGIPLNNAVTGEVNLADLDPQAFSRIEIHRSGGRDSSAGGSVHLFTGEDSNLKAATEAGVLAGSFGTAGANAKKHDVGEKQTRPSYRVSARTEVSRQDFTFHNDNGTPILNRYDDFEDVRENAGYRNVFSTATAGYETGNTRFSLLNDFVFRRHGLPGPYTAPTQKVYRKFWRNTVGAASDTRGLGADWFRLKSRVYYTESRENLDDYLQEFSFSLPNSHSQLQQYGAELEPFVYLLGYHQTLRVTGGVERQAYHADRRNRFDDVIEKQPTRFRNSSFARIEDEFSFFKERLLLLPAISVERHADRFQEPTAEIDPATGLPRKPKQVTEFTHYSFGTTGIPIQNKTWEWKVRAQGETGGRMPMFVELFGQRGSIIGNPALRPENSESVEAGSSLAWRTKDWRVEGSITGFRRVQRDLILFVPNSQFTLRPENVDAAEVRGAESNLRLHYQKWLEAYGSYTYQRAINRSDLPFLRGKYLPLRPLHEAQSGVILKGKHLSGGFEASFVGASFRDRTNEVTGYEPARTIMNLFATYSVFGRDEPVRRWLIGIEVKNVANVRATDVTGFPLPGRSYYAKTSYRF